MVLYSFNGWTKIVELSVFKQIRQISKSYQTNFGKSKIIQPFTGFVAVYFFSVFGDQVKVGA